MQLVSYLLADNPKALKKDEEAVMKAVHMLVLAGFHTSSFLLSGVLYYLLKDATAFKKASVEFERNFELWTTSPLRTRKI
jgi:cytochrome P450